MKQLIKTSKTIDQLFEDFKIARFDNLGAKPFCSSYLYLDNGEGRSDYAPFSIEARQNEVIVTLLKKDIPHFWRDHATYLFEDCLEKVKGAIEE